MLQYIWLTFNRQYQVALIPNRIPTTEQASFSHGGYLADTQDRLAFKKARLWEYRYERYF